MISKETNQPKIYTRDTAAHIVEMFENVLSRYDIHVPSPEDDDRSIDDFIGLYGSVYSDLLDEVENELIELLNNSRKGGEIISDMFSGNT